nr:hypothetical protein [uncultured Mucilaginibacter sp.]
MKKHLLLTFILSATLYCTCAYAQTAKETALEKAKNGVKLGDEDKFEEALKLLDEAQKLDPDNVTYPYEITYIYYRQEKYQAVIDVLEKLKERQGSYDRIYQLLGNSYDNLKQSNKAIAIYEEGLKKFPRSGPLYLERGIMPLIQKDYNGALNYFEKGIELAPEFSSNYYRAATLYLDSEDSMWGMIYGELFMNLERNSERTREMSKLLYDNYKARIKFLTPNKAMATFSKNNVMTLNGKLPYSLIYEPTLLIGLGDEKSIDLNSLDRIRQGFLKFYLRQGFDKKYPNALFDYQNQILQAGHMEAYNHWLLMMGDEPAFNTWMEANKTKWDAFVKWYLANPLKLNDTHKFYRMQY